MQLFYVTSHVGLLAVLLFYTFEKFLLPECLSLMEKVALIRLTIAQIFFEIGAPT